jgi:hypothetical protein
MSAVPRAEDEPTVCVARGCQWFGVSAATLYRAIAEGRAPCDVVRVGSRVGIVTASARRVLGLDATDAAPDQGGAANFDTAEQTRHATPLP